MSSLPTVTRTSSSVNLGWMNQSPARWLVAPSELVFTWPRQPMMISPSLIMLRECSDSRDRPEIPMHLAALLLRLHTSRWIKLGLLLPHLQDASMPSPALVDQAFDALHAFVQSYAQHVSYALLASHLFETLSRYLMREWRVSLQPLTDTKSASAMWDPAVLRLLREGRSTDAQRSTAARSRKPDLQ